MSEIIVHLFDVPQDIFEKIFKGKGEMIEKKYGKIETRTLKEESNWLSDFTRSMLNFFKKTEIPEMKWLG